MTYAQLLEIFWHNVDPTDGGGQFCDRGSQYRTGIFIHGDEQQRLAEQSKKDIEASGQLKKKRIVTEIVPAGDFYAAEVYHQDYYLRNPVRYKFYRYQLRPRRPAEGSLGRRGRPLIRVQAGRRKVRPALVHAGADGAAVQVIVHEPHGLHERVDGRRSHEGPAAGAQVAAEGDGRGRRRHRAQDGPGEAARPVGRAPAPSRQK